MILRTYFILIACWLTGHSTDGMYLKYKLFPNNAELTIATIPRNDNARSPRDVGHWIHRNRKKLVVLDRKNKFVAAFIQKLIKLIEKEKNAENLKSISKLSNAQKTPCYRNFGHLFNSRFRKCEPSTSSQATTKPILKLMTPIKSENVFVDSTRQRSDDDLEDLTSGDTDSFSDTSDYSDEDFFERRESIVQNFRRQGHPLLASSDSSDDDSSNSKEVVQSGKRLKRFEVVTNGNVTKKEPSKTNVNSESDSDEKRVQSENDSVREDVRQEETDSDQEKVLLAPTYSAKTVKAHDTDEDLDNEASEVDEEEPKKPKKIKPKVIKKPKLSGELTSLEDISEVKTSKKKKQSNNYVYLQGPQPVNSDMETDDDARRDGMNRLRNFFMPKRNIWDSSEIQHLSYYWFNGPQGRVLYS